MSTPNNFGSLHNQRILFRGKLSLKRCHLKWRPRYAELVSTPSYLEGHGNSFQLLLFEAKKQYLKSRIKLDDVVTLCSSMDCHFQLYLVGRKILQLKTDTTEKQAQWMALIKVGLGKGTIFYVQVHASEILQHALLYSIQINLPAHRIGQLDSVLVLASPINDVCINAWDFNHIQCFFQMDIGIRMEMCAACLKTDQNMSITFVMDKRFIKNCMEFLCRESHIKSHPVNKNGLLVYNVPHSCFRQPPPSIYSEFEPYDVSLLNHEYDLIDDEELSITPSDETVSRVGEEKESNLDKLLFQHDKHSLVSSASGFRLTDGAMVGSPSLITPRTMPAITSKHPPLLVSPHAPTHRHNHIVSSSSSTSSSGESIFLLDEMITAVPEARSPVDIACSKATHASFADVPPRNITREKYVTSIPASSSSAISYYNLQTHFLQNTTGSLTTPYQISSQMSGDVHYERSPLGNKPWENGRFHLLKSIPLPPRGLRARSGMQEELDPTQKIQTKPVPPSRTVKRYQRDGSTRSCYPTKHFAAASATSTTDDLQVYKKDIHSSTLPHGSAKLYTVPSQYTPTSYESVSGRQTSWTSDSSMDFPRSHSSSDLIEASSASRTHLKVPGLIPNEKDTGRKLYLLTRAISDNSLDRSINGPKNNKCSFRDSFYSSSPPKIPDIEGSDLENAEFFKKVQHLNLVDAGYVIQKDHEMTPRKLRLEHIKIATDVEGIGLGSRRRREEERDWHEIAQKEYQRKHGKEDCRFSGVRRVTLPNSLAEIDEHDKEYLHQQSNNTSTFSNTLEMQQLNASVRRDTFPYMLAQNDNHNRKTLNQKIDHVQTQTVYDNSSYKHSLSFPLDMPSSSELPEFRSRCGKLTRENFVVARQMPVYPISAKCSSRKLSNAVADYLARERKATFIASPKEQSRETSTASTMVTMGLRYTDDTREAFTQ